VFTLECTQKLLRHLDRLPSADPSTPSTRLGDWCGNVVPWHRSRLVLLVSMRSLLPVLLPVVPVQELLDVFPRALAQVLFGVGVAPSRIERELREMSEARLARTTSRRILGSMTDFVYMLDGHPPGDVDLTSLALELAEAPCSPIAMRSPAAVARELLDAGE
jgi:hypothetical protein